MVHGVMVSWCHGAWCHGVMVHGVMVSWRVRARSLDSGLHMVKHTGVCGVGGMSVCVCACALVCLCVCLHVYMRVWACVGWYVSLRVHISICTTVCV
jgi:hypothetical protein